VVPDASSMLTMHFDIQAFPSRYQGKGLCKDGTPSSLLTHHTQASLALKEVFLKATSDMERGLPEGHVQIAPSQGHSVTSPSIGYSWGKTFRQLWCFSLVGGLNTLIDLLILNMLLWLFPTQSTFLLIIYNSIAYGIGAINSFVLNKYWTFSHKQRTTATELLRFAVTTCVGIAGNDLLIWIVGGVLHPFISNPALWTNTSKVIAIFGTSSISYLGMRLWVFVHQPQKEK